MDTLTKQKIAATFLSLSPMKAAEVLKHLNEYQALKVGEALCQYGHIRFNLSQILKKDLSVSQENNDTTVTEKDISRFIDAYKQSHPQASPQILSRVQKQKDMHTDTLLHGLGTGTVSLNPSSEKMESESFLRIIADDHSSLEVIKALYRTAYGDKKAAYLMRKLVHSQLSDDFSFLHRYTTKEIYAVINTESVPIISFVMEVMESSKSAALLTMLSEEQRGEVILYIAKRKLPNIQACQTIRNVLKDKLKKNEEHKKATVSTGGVDALMEILSHMPFSQQKQLIDTIQDKELKMGIEEKIMNWKLLFKLPSSILQTIFQAYTDGDIALLLCLQEEYAQELIKQSVSENRMQKIEEEMLYLQKSNVSLRKAKELRDAFFKSNKQYLSYMDEEVL